MQHKHVPQILNYIGGELVAPIQQRFADNINPATGEVFSQVPLSDAQDVEQAVACARQAFPIWSSYSPQRRSKILRQISDLIQADLQDLAYAESIDNGKPLQLALTVDIPRAAQNFSFFADAITQFSSDCYPMSAGALNYTLQKPLGVVGVISPWNLPLYLLTWKLAPALAAGNCVVAKPSELTPYTAFKLSELLQRVDIPAGVINIVHGTGSDVGEKIVTHPHVKAISFTGGTTTGAHIATVAAPHFKKISLELGGKNPNIIFPDAPYERMLATTLRSSFANQGEICLSGPRIFVHADIYEKFKKDFVQNTLQLKVGNPLEESTDLGALVSQAHLHKVQHYLQIAQFEGGTILTGGERVLVEGNGNENGFFMSPTIIEGLSPNARTNQEEIFGPVVTLTPFRSEEEVITMANSTPYGLSASIWTQNLERAHRLSQAMDCGMVWVNCWMLRDLRTPFGGVKNSGVGREGGMQSLHFFTETQNICLQYS